MSKVNIAVRYDSEKLNAIRLCPMTVSQNSSRALDNASPLSIATQKSQNAPVVTAGSPGRNNS